MGDAIRDWAKENNIQEFVPKFIEAGFDTLDVISEIDSSDLDFMKIELPGHRKKVLLAVSKLKSSLQPQTQVNQNNGGDDLDKLEREATEGRKAILEMINNQSNSNPMEQIQNLLPHFQSVLNFTASNQPNELFEAVSNSDQNKLLRLLQNSASSSSIYLNQYCDGQTPLHVAVSKFDEEIVRILLNAGANYKLTDKRGKNILILAMAFQDINMIKIILNHDTTQYSDTLETNDDNNGKGSILLDNDGGGRSMLYLACCQPNLALVATLLEYIPHVQINRKNSDSEQQTPIFAAVSRCDVDLCEMLLRDYHADPNIPDATGTTPLLCAVVDHNSLQLVEVLLKYGARIDIIDETGLGPVDAAAVLEKPELLELLLRYEKQQQNDCSAFIYHQKSEN